MTRTIKFRVWDSIAHQMYDAFDLKEMMMNTDLTPMAEHYIYLQFTGLFDKNGKEIYEGDVVSINRNHNYFPQVTEFDKPFNVEVKYWDVMFTPLCIVGGDCEIIGNIWENPELIKN